VTQAWLPSGSARIRRPRLVGVAHDGLPERADGGDVQRVDRDLQQLRRPRAASAGVSGQPEVGQGRGDPGRDLGFARGDLVGVQALQGQDRPVPAHVGLQARVGIRPGRPDCGAGHVGRQGAAASLLQLEQIILFCYAGTDRFVPQPAR
jgi:hypothetical protein